MDSTTGERLGQKLDRDQFNYFYFLLIKVNKLVQVKEK